MWLKLGEASKTFQSSCYTWRNQGQEDGEITQLLLTPALIPSTVQHPAIETFLGKKKKKSAIFQNLSKPES